VTTVVEVKIRAEGVMTRIVIIAIWKYITREVNIRVVEVEKRALNMIESEGKGTRLIEMKRRAIKMTKREPRNRRTF
jgi:hypothetical protein